MLPNNINMKVLYMLLEEKNNHQYHPSVSLVSYNNIELSESHAHCYKSTQVIWEKLTAI